MQKVLSILKGFMKEYILRNEYIKQITPFVDKDLIKVITGQRRIGKSYLLFQLIDVIKKANSKANIIYINKELYEFDFIKDYHDLLNFVNEKTVQNIKNYLFVDEIQDIVQFEKALRSLLTEKHFDIYCTGSNARFLSSDLATYLSGRYIEFRVYSLSYGEFLIFHKLENNSQSLQFFMKFGGLPYLRNLSLNDEIIFDYLKNVFNTIILKDVVTRYNIRNVSFLENLIKYIADNTGSVVSAKKISDYLKSRRTSISPNIVLNYLNYLSSAFFIAKIRRIDVKGKRVFEIGEKYYFEDMGLRHVVKPFVLTDIQKILENVVYNHLLFCGYKVSVGNLVNKEIDFVAEKKSEKIYIQVAYRIDNKSTEDREFGNLLAINDNYRKFVISMDEIQSASFEGIEHFYLGDFLIQFK